MRCASLAAIIGVALLAAPAAATVYEIGPGKTYTTIGEAPWGTLQPGDNVKIYPGTYHEKLEITVRGTQANPIVIEGIPDGSTLPVIDAVGATEGPNFNVYRSWQFGPGLGLVYFGAPVGGATKPGYITLKNLRIQGANAGVTWTPNGGSPTTMTGDLSAVYIQTGEHLTFEGLEITDSGNGFFANSNYGSSPEIISRDITVRKCRIWGNGSTTSYLVHNVYTEADGIVFEYNWFGPPRANALGNNFKDRSQGLIFRHNWIMNGGHIMDLVECQAGCGYFTASKYNEAWVYGNVIVNSQPDPDGALGAAAYMIQFGAESNDGNSGTVGGGRDHLYFYHNTVVMYLDASFFKVRLFDISDSGADGTKETVHIYNNLIVSRPYTNGQSPCPWYWRTDTKSPYTHGTLEFGVNAVSSNWSYEFQSADTSNVTGAANLYSITSPTTLFTDIAIGAQQFTLAAGSEAIDRAGSLPAIVSSGNSLSLDLTPVAQYVKHQSSTARTLNGAVLDAGAYEYDGYVAPTITTTQLPNGVRDAAYESTTLAVTNGTAPYTWTVSAGTICDGLSLSAAGVITGTPTTVGTCSFTARVQDAITSNDTQALTITITAPPPSLSVSVQAGSTSAVVTYSLAGLASNQSCFATLRNAGTGAVLDQQTAATGMASRLASFSGLNAGGSYKAEAACGASSSPQVTFTTKAVPETASAYFLKLKPAASTLARMTALDATLASARAAVYWQAPGEGSYTSTATACSSGCTVSKTSLASGVHSYYHAWIAGTAYATGALNWTHASYPSDGETVTVGSITYTFRDTVAQPFDVKIAPDSTEASYNNLWEAIDYGNWTPGVSPNAPGANYYATAKNPDVVRLTWSAPGNTATLRATVLGSGGNSIPLSETSASMTVTPLSGGTDATIATSAARPAYVPIP